MRKQCDFSGHDKKCPACGFVSIYSHALRECTGQFEQQEPPPPVEQMPTRSAPGFLTKVKNFATAAAGHVAAGMPMASDAEIIRRHDICLACEHLVDNACTQCGCPVARVRGYVSKLSWADSECPVGKWGKAPSA